jgi:AcrR family transcriptional regulator
MRKKTDVPSRITRAAVALFSRQGYHGTSTRDIARLADVSEVTLYRYFEHKEDVFWAALTSCFDSLKPRLSALEPAGRNAPPEVFLPRIVNVLVDTTTFSPELARLVAVAVLEVRGKAEQVCREHMTPLFTIITNYLQNHIDSGAIRNLNPAIMTMGIALTVLVQPEISRLIEGCHLSRLELRQVVDTYTEFWLGALVQPCRKEPLESFSSEQVLSA